jgi:hypothetical protein
MIEASTNVNGAARSRQRVLAVFLPISAALYIGAEATNPRGVDQVITTTVTALKVLPIAQQHTTQLYISGSLSVLALGALAVSFAAIATLMRERASTLATVAALVGGIGYFCGAIINVFVGLNVAAVASSHLMRDDAAHLLVTTFNSGSSQVLLDLYAMANFIAPLLMGIALWRSRCVSRWIAVLFFVGLEIAEEVPSAGPVKVVLFMAPFAVALILLASRVWRAADTTIEPHFDPTVAAKVETVSL